MDEVNDMAYILTKKGRNDNVPIGEFTCDFESDIKLLPVNAPFGSTAYVIETGNVYIKDSEGNWKVMK